MISLKWAINKCKKKYTRIDITTLIYKAFTLLDNVNSNNEDDIDEVLNYFDTEFYVEEETNDISASTSWQIKHNLLISKASDHLLSKADE